MNKTIRSANWIWSGVLALVLMTATMFGQGVTTSGISGFVTDKNGTPISGAKIVVTHVPTGTRYLTVSNKSGTYAIDGLRPGGPYAIEATAPDGTTAQESELFVDVGSNLNENLKPGSEIVTLAAVRVGATRDTKFDGSSMGTSMAFNAKDIATVNSVRQDIQDIENLDPRTNLQQSANGDANYTLSVQGQNPRENLVLVDGVSASDNFGLNSNGYAGLRNPLPLDWIESFTFDLNTYDVAYSGFVGAVADATLKSGTNQFHGDLYELYTGTNFRGPDPVPNPLGAHEQMQARTSGATFGGPILKDKLFFFVGYEAFREVAQPTPPTFNPFDTAADTAVIDQILAVAKSEGYAEQGSYVTSAHTWQQNFVAKVDWNISDNHKFDFTFRHNDGRSPLEYNYTSSFETSLSGSWYDSHRVDQSYTAKFNSDWNYIIPGLTTELEGTFRLYNGTAIPEGTLWPATTIILGNFGSYPTGAAPTELFLGTSASYQDNNLHTQEVEEHFYADYALGTHTFKFGAAFDRVQLTNTFIQNTLGSYTFSNVQDFLNATPTGATQTVASPGFTLSQSVAHFWQLNIAPSLQDTWKPIPNLTLLGGVRLDYPYMNQEPPLSTVFLNSAGFPNTQTINGHYVISPRFGFNWDVSKDETTQIHGGAGLFVASPPYVWLENSFNNAGLTTSASVTNSAKIIPGYTFAGANTGPVPANAGAPAENIDFISHDFQDPANWKENIAIDHKLPFGNITVTAEIDLSQVEKDIYYTSNNLKLATSGPATMPDGAIRYNGNITPSNIGSAYFVPGYTTSNFYTSVSSQGSAALETNPKLSQVLELNNTDKGGSQEYTLQIQRKMKDSWAWSLAYTHTHATQVAELGGTTASGGTTSPFVNPNDNIAYRSEYAIPDKFILTLDKEINFFKKPHAETTFTAQYIAQSGQPYSFVFKGDADGSGNNNQLFYVPSGPNDPNVQWISAAEENNFFNVWLPSHPTLEKYMGKIAPRNAFAGAWQHTLNASLSQSIPVWRDIDVKLFATMFNFANLFNKKWGIVENYGQYNYPYGEQTVAGTGYNAKTNQYLYTFNPGTLGAPQVYSDMSRWYMQVGVKLEF